MGAKVSVPGRVNYTAMTTYWGATVVIEMERGQAIGGYVAGRWRLTLNVEKPHETSYPHL